MLYPHCEVIANIENKSSETLEDITIIVDMHHNTKPNSKLVDTVKK